MITLKVKQLPPGLVEAGNLQPATLGALDATALARHPLGATQSSPCIGDCFGIKVRGGDPVLLIEGDVPTLTGIGRSMDEGVLIVEAIRVPRPGRACVQVSSSSRVTLATCWALGCVGA